MSRAHYKVVAMVVLLFLALPLWAQNQVAGHLSAVKGSVSLERHQSVPALLHNGDELRSGDQIRTDSKSSATVKLSDGSTVRIYPGSRVELRPENGKWKEFLHVLLGNVRVKIEKLSGRPNPKVTTTPTAIIAVRGTTFAVAVEQSGDTQVGLETGLIAVANLLHPEHEVLVEPGQETWVRGAQEPGTPQRMQRPLPGLAGPGSSGIGMGGPGGTGMKRPGSGGRRGPSM